MVLVCNNVITGYGIQACLARIKHLNYTAEDIVN